MKRIISLVTTIVICLTCVTGTVVSVGIELPPYTFGRPGDVNGDGNINITDVTLVLKEIANWDVTINLESADVTDDARITLDDVTLLLKYIAGWNVSLK